MGVYQDLYFPEIGKIDFSKELEAFRETIEDLFQVFCIKAREPKKEKGSYYMRLLQDPMRGLGQLQAQQQAASSGLQNYSSYAGQAQGNPFAALGSCLGH